MMRVRVYHENDQYLDPREAVCRLVKEMPTMLVDWARGDKIVEEQYKKLVSQNAPNVILGSHKALFQNTAYVQVWFPEFGDTYASFLIQPYQLLMLECSDSTNDQCLLFVAARVADALGYKFRTDQGRTPP